jgi:hypothetical protein
MIFDPKGIVASVDSLSRWSERQSELIIVCELLPDNFLYTQQASAMWTTQNANGNLI